jgi:hypothetical protein
VKPTTSQGKERGRSTGIEEKIKGYQVYESTNTSANTSFALNSSYQQNQHNSFDYYQPGRNSLNNPNITMYNGDSKRRPRQEYSPMNFYNTNFNGFIHKRGNTKS